MKWLIEPERPPLYGLGLHHIVVYARPGQACGEWGEPLAMFPVLAELEHETEAASANADVAAASTSAI